MEKGSLIGILVGGVVLGIAIGAGTMQVVNKGKLGGSASNDAMSCSVTGGPGSLSQPLFMFDGKNYSQGDLNIEIQGNITRIQSQAYQQLSAYLREVAVRVAAAKEKKLAEGTLPELTDLLDGVNVSEQEVNAIIEAQKKNLPKDVKMEDIKKQVMNFLKRQRGQQFFEQKLQTLQNEGKFKILIDAPVGRPLKTEGYPTKGPTSAPVKVAIVSDFLCGHCRNRQPEFAQAMVDFADRVQFYHITFALQPEGLSGALTRGVYCAQQQSNDLYWKYEAGAQKISPESARAVSPDAATEFKNQALGVAKEAGLDVAAFGKCIDSKEAVDYLKSSNEMLAAAGVDSTPTIFVNGKRVLVNPGQLSKIITDSLAEVK